MCALCGVLGAQDHWTDSAGAPGAFARRSEMHTRQRERQARTRVLNAVLRHYGLSLSDWSGNAYILSSRTGRTQVVDTLGQLWPAAERLSGRRCDPLEDGLLGALGPTLG
jgi:hypothetical protein